MKKLFLLLMALMLLCMPVLAEDATSSATLAVDDFPRLPKGDSRILVVFFSPEKTVYSAAIAAANALGSEIFEIRPAEPYTAEDLNYHDRQSRTSIEMNDPASRPEIEELPVLDRFDTILLGYPIWWGQAPRILCTFVESVDLSGKTVIPFCTSGSSGAGSSAVNLQKLGSETAVWLDAKRFNNGSTKEDVYAWVESLNLQ